MAVAYSNARLYVGAALLQPLGCCWWYECWTPFIHFCTQACVCTLTPHIHTRVRTCVRTRMRTHTRAHIHTHARARARTITRTHARTHAGTHKSTHIKAACICTDPDTQIFIMSDRLPASHGGWCQWSSWATVRVVPAANHTNHAANHINKSHCQSRHFGISLLFCMQQFSLFFTYSFVPGPFPGAPLLSANGGCSIFPCDVHVKSPPPPNPVQVLPPCAWLVLEVPLREPVVRLPPDRPPPRVAQAGAVRAS